MLNGLKGPIKYPNIELLMTGLIQYPRKSNQTRKAILWADSTLGPPNPSRHPRENIERSSHTRTALLSKTAPAATTAGSFLVKPGALDLDAMLSPPSFAPSHIVPNLTLYSRRTVASAAAATAASPSPAGGHGRRPLRYAVLGAGFAGLSVAWHLLKVTLHFPSSFSPGVL